MEGNKSKRDSLDEGGGKRMDDKSSSMYTVRRLLRTSSHVICGNYYTQHYDVFNEHGMGLLLASENSNKRKFN